MCVCVCVDMTYDREPSPQTQRIDYDESKLLKRPLFERTRARYEKLDVVAPWEEQVVKRDVLSHEDYKVLSPPSVTSSPISGEGIVYSSGDVHRSWISTKSLVLAPTLRLPWRNGS